MKKFKTKNNEKMGTSGITLVALVVTIIILLILAGIAISQINNTGLFKNAKLAKEKYTNSQNNENATIDSYSKQIEDYEIAGNGRDTVTLTQEEYNNLINRGVDIIFETTSSGTTSIDLNTYNKSFSDYDLFLVEFQAGGGYSQLILYTQKTNTSKFTYTYGDGYVYEQITANKENNTITLSSSGNNNTWSSSSGSFIKKVLGIKL